MRGDKLKCIRCGSVFFNTYPDFQDKVVQNCPYCLSNYYKNLGQEDRRKKKSKKNQNNGLFGIVPVDIVWSREYDCWLNVLFPRWL